MNFKCDAMNKKSSSKQNSELSSKEGQREKSIWKAKPNEKIELPWPLDNYYWFRLLVMHRSYDNRIFLCKITHGQVVTAFKNIDKMQCSIVVTVRQRQTAVAMTRFAVAFFFLRKIQKWKLKICIIKFVIFSFEVLHLLQSYRRL